MRFDAVFLNHIVAGELGAGGRVATVFLLCFGKRETWERLTAIVLGLERLVEYNASAILYRFRIACFMILVAVLKRFISVRRRFERRWALLMYLHWNLCFLYLRLDFNLKMQRCGRCILSTNFYLVHISRPSNLLTSRYKVPWWLGFTRIQYM